jgi:transcriptional regulator with XRE-family HTH domain
MTGQQLGERVGKGQSWVAKVENGRLLPSVADVERWADATGARAEIKAELVDTVTALHTESQSWRALHRPSFRRHQRELQRMEQAAKVVRLFQPNVVPGLLQTAEYCRHVLQASGFVDAVENLTDAVAARVERQATLYDESKTFRFVVTEGALRWRLCSVGCHLAQLDRIASLSTLANVRIGIVPWSAYVPNRPANMFMVLDDVAVLVETMHGEDTLKERQQIDAYIAAFDALDSLAQHDDDARATLARIADDVRSLSD